MENDHESAPKRLRTHSYIQPISQIDVKDKAPANKCLLCKQYENEVLLYNGHPNFSEDEHIALTDERLLLFTGEEADVDQQDARPINKITLFNIYDKKGHLVAIDSGLIEQDILLYVSGYIKPICDEDASAENGIPAHDIGPINAWYISGYDGGEKAIVFFSTAYADYYMMAPSDSYAPIMRTMNVKIKLAKIVIEFLVEESWAAPDYEDLLQRLASYEDPTINEECLIRHAQFICDQILSVDDHDDDDDDDESLPFIALPCIRNLVKMGGVDFHKRTGTANMPRKSSQTSAASSKWSKATTTHLVRHVMENYFTDQIAADCHNENDEWGPKKQRCAVCEACQQPDCGNCSHCRAMLKFGGSGRTKQACKLRRCPNMAIQAAEDSNDDDIELNLSTNSDSVEIPCSKRIIHEVQWIGHPLGEYQDRTVYTEAKIGNTSVATGDYVVLNPETKGHPLLVAEVVYMWANKAQGAMFHAHAFIRGCDTILGETADPREIFYSDNCHDCPVGAIVRRARVELRVAPDSLPTQCDDDGVESFYFSKKYTPDVARFEDLTHLKTEETDDTKLPLECVACCSRDKRKQFNTPIYNDHSVTYHGETYKVGSAVYLAPGIFDFAVEQTLEQDDKLISQIDKVLYPEYYRKSSENKSLHADTPEPFCIGLIEDIMVHDTDVRINVKMFYRPENTHNGKVTKQTDDLNLLFYSDKEKIVNFVDVHGKCFVSYHCNIDQSPDEWFKSGPNRYYFRQQYNADKFRFEDVPQDAMRIGLCGKGATKLQNKSTRVSTKALDVSPTWDTIEPLRCLDVFAGCGGLSEGLHQAGVAKTFWAIEKDKAAAHAFQINNRNTKVFHNDCNELLKDVMESTGRYKDMPAKGDVELLVGGPPCQGFSGMNRFNAGQYSLFKNSLIVSYLSYCDYYRPKYFILENVRNFVTFKKSLVLKLTLRCLLAMGYQATFGVVQAGHYGVPQTRRRLIIFAAAPGYQLPQYPEPLHVFSRRGSQLTILINNHRYSNGTRWMDSAPLRATTVSDAMCDLPPIKNGASMRCVPYDNEAVTHYQRLMRGSVHNATLTDHVCKLMGPIVEARMSYVPLAAGSDWRDLPNIVVRLKDGTYTNKLRYEYRTRKQKLREDPKGVCQCTMKGAVCDPTDRQFNTLIPWCLPHTGDRHNNWSGLYGRLEWNGYFSTTVTNPEPMGKQGRVLHPEQHRVVSVRECARSQGFPDAYQFAGGILDKHRQVGNAVPPPLGAALGREILKAYLQSYHKHL